MRISNRSSISRRNHGASKSLPWKSKMQTCRRKCHRSSRQAGAERERRAKVIHAEGEFGASQRLADTADVIGRNPVACNYAISRHSSKSGRGKFHHDFPQFHPYDRPLFEMADPEVDVAIRPIALYPHLHTCSKAASPPLRLPH